MFVFEFVFNEGNYVTRKEIAVVSYSAKDAVNYFTGEELKGLSRMTVKPAMNALDEWISE